MAYEMTSEYVKCDHSEKYNNSVVCIPIGEDTFILLCNDCYNRIVGEYLADLFRKSVKEVLINKNG